VSNSRTIPVDVEALRTALEAAQSMNEYIAQTRTGTVVMGQRDMDTLTGRGDALVMWLESVCQRQS